MTDPKLNEMATTTQRGRSVIPEVKVKVKVKIKPPKGAVDRSAHNPGNPGFPSANSTSPPTTRSKGHPMAEKWMQKAFANSHGQFKAKAKKAGMSTAAYANKVTKESSTASTKTKRQANLAKLGAKYGGGKKSAKQPHPKTNPGFYDTEPHAPRKSITSGKLTQTASLGDAKPAMTPGMPGKTTGFGGMAHASGAHIPRAHGFGHSVVNRLGSLRLSGHIGAHRIGKR